MSDTNTSGKVNAQPAERKPWQAPQVIFADADDTDAKIDYFVEGYFYTGPPQGPAS